MVVIHVFNQRGERWWQGPLVFEKVMTWTSVPTSNPVLVYVSDEALSLPLLVFTVCVCALLSPFYARATMILTVWTIEMLFCYSLLLHLEKNETLEVIDVQHSIGYSWRPIYATLSFLCVDVERAEVVVGGRERGLEDMSMIWKVRWTHKTNLGWQRGFCEVEWSYLNEPIAPR